MFKRDLRASKRVCLILSLTPAIFQSVCLHLSIYKTLAIRFSSFIFGPYIFQIKEYNNQNTIPLTVSCSYNPYDFASCTKQYSHRSWGRRNETQPSTKHNPRVVDVTTAKQSRYSLKRNVAL